MGRKAINTDSWVRQAKDRHGNKYDYSCVNYTKYACLVKIVCPTHGPFEQIEHNHRNGAGCPQCGADARREKRAYDFESFLRKAREVHGTHYEYPPCEVVNSRSKVRIVCPLHGEFEKVVYAHLAGQGCKVCSGERKGRRSQLGISEFLERAKSVHGDTYEYLSGLSRLHKNIKIQCRIHGVFNQTPHNHLKGAGCPRCANKVSKGEAEMFEFVKSLGFDVDSSNRKLLAPYEIDIYVPEKRVAIEYNGLYYHRHDLIGHKTRMKAIMCQEKGITLMQVFEDEWCEARSKVEGRIRALLGKADKVPARKCQVVKVDKSEAREFLETHHMQNAGTVLKFAYGLYYQDELVAVATFGRGRFGHDGWELLRFASKGTVVGGMSRLLKAFMKDYPAGDIISYADMRWGSGDSYGKVGFQLLGMTEPDYWWVDGATSKRVPRYKVQSQKTGVSEGELAKSKNWYKVQGVGHKKWLLKR